DLDAGDDARAVDLEDPHGDATVVDEDAVTGLAVARKAGVRRRGDLRSAGDVLGGDGEGLALVQLDLALDEPPEADLRALEVDEDGDGPAGGLGCGAHPVVHLRVLGGLAMAAVDPRHVHPRIDEGLDLVRGLGRRTDGAHDLRSTHGGHPIARIGPGEGDVRLCGRPPRSAIGPARRCPPRSARWTPSPAPAGPSRRPGNGPPLPRRTAPRRSPTR